MSYYSITNESPRLVNSATSSLYPMAAVSATPGVSDGKYPEYSEQTIGDLAKSALSCDQTEHLQNDRESALKLIKKKMIARRKTRNLRDSIVTTNQMFSLIQSSHLKINPSLMHNISYILARQINEMTQDLSRYHGKSLVLDADKDCPIYSYETGRKEMVKIGLKSWFEVSEDGQEIEVFMAATSEKPIGTGSYKKIFKAQSLKIPLKAKLSINEASNQSLYTRDSSCTPMVLMQARKKMGIKVEEGIQLQNKLARLMPHAVFTSLPKEPKLTLEPSQNPHKLYRQEWYNSDLWAARQIDAIPLDMSDNPQVFKLKTVDYLNAFSDVARTLLEWHKAGFVHHDVNLKNILLQMSSDNKTICGILADYDIAQKPGPGIVAEYQYWDALAEKGIVTPFTDVYGLTMSLADVIIPEFHSKKPLDILSETKQKSYLLQTLQNHHLIVPKYICNCSRSVFLEKNKKMLKGAINKYEGEKKLRFQMILDEFQIVEDTIALTLKIVTANNALSKSMEGKRCLMAEFIHDSASDFSLKQQELCLASDLKACFYPHKNTFSKLITSKILNWKKRLPDDKIETTLGLVSYYLQNPHVDEKTKAELIEASNKIECRKIALQFIAKFGKPDSENKKKHPLYIALTKPMELENLQIINDYLYREIEIIDVFKNEFFREILTQCDSVDNAFDKRETLKSFLTKTIKNPNENEGIKCIVNNALNQIINIEKGMTIALEMHDRYEEMIAGVMQEAPTMSTFLAELDIIKTRLAPLNPVTVRI